MSFLLVPPVDPFSDVGQYIWRLASQGISPELWCPGFFGGVSQVGAGCPHD